MQTPEALIKKLTQGGQRDAALKIARALLQIWEQNGHLVTHYAHRLQVQERLTNQVAEWLMLELSPKGVGVVMEAEHACMSLRGIRATGARTVTSSLLGLVRDDERTRAEFLTLVGPR